MTWVPGPSSPMPRLELLARRGWRRGGGAGGRQPLTSVSGGRISSGNGGRRRSSSPRPWEGPTSRPRSRGSMHVARPGIRSRCHLGRTGLSPGGDEPIEERLVPERVEEVIDHEANGLEVGLGLRRAGSRKGLREEGWTRSTYDLRRHPSDADPLRMPSP